MKTAKFVAPKNFLSVSDNAFRVIIDGHMPCCADKKTASEALQAAKQLNVNVDTHHFWDGYKGQWAQL